MKLKLILLGLLKDGARHGYELKKIIEEEIKPLTNVTLTSIYYTLEKLAQKGYLLSQKEQEGHRPERRVYSLTPKGEKYLNKLLIRNFLLLERPFFNLDLVLYFLDRLPSKRIIKKLIKKRIARLEETVQWSNRMKKTVKTQPQLEGKLLIPIHLKKLLEVELEFTKELERIFLQD